MGHWADLGVVAAAGTVVVVAAAAGGWVRHHHQHHRRHHDTMTTRAWRCEICQKKKGKKEVAPLPLSLE